jgi:platelet-activating factor acetylhydrolase IB subunit beta/gamma
MILLLPSALLRAAAFVFLALFGAALTGIPAYAAGTTPGPADSIAVEPRAEPPYPDWLLRRIETLRARDPEAILLGDSLIAGWPEEDWHALLPGGAMNFGAGGDTSGNLLWRVRQAFAPGMRLRAALLLVGTNDVARQPAEAIAGTIATIVATVEADAPEVCVTVVGLLPRRDGRADLDAKIEDVNRRLAGLASPRVRVVDPHPMLRASCPKAGPCDLYKDKIHLAPAGYERLTSLIAQAQQAHPCA